MPRPKNSVWKFFHRSEKRKNGKHHFVATCKYCDPPFTIDGQPQRMIKHLLEQCENVPEHVKVGLSSLKDTTSVTLPLSQPSMQNLQNTFLKLHTKNNQSNKRQKIQKPIENYADKCSSEEQKEINQYLARAIFGGGLPLSLVEDEYFIAFCKKLRPAYELPTRKKLSTDLLDNTYKDVTKNITQHVEKSKSVCITSDGWTNS
jgi:BED zinc finger